MTQAKNFLLFIFFPLLVACGGSKSLTQKPEKSPKLIADEPTRFQFEQAYLSGEQARAVGNYEEAVRHYTEALRIFPKSAAAHYALAELYFGKSRANIALLEINMAIEIEQSNVHFYDLQAQICHALTKHNEAAAAFEQIIRLQPGNADAYFDAANQYIYAKNYDAALATYEKMEKRFGVGEDLIRQKEQLYLMLNKPDKAVAELKKLIRIAPYEARYKGMLAELYWTMDKKKEALALYQEILSQDPTNGLAHFGMAEYYRSENNKTEMLRSLEAAFKDPLIAARNKINVVFSLLPLLERDPSLKATLFRMAEIIKTAHPNEALSYSVLGDFYLADNNKEAAKNEYAVAVQLDPANLMVWQQYLSLLFDLSDYKKLQEQSDIALELFPEQDFLYYFNAIGHFNLKNFRDVATSCKLGLGLYAANEDINHQLLVLLGDAHHNLNEHEDSDKAFEKSLELDPDDTYVLNNYAYYLSLRKHNLERAKSLSAKTLELEPNSASYLDTYGWILFQMNDTNGALEFIGKSLAINPENPEVLEHMGDVLKKLNRSKEAKEYWERALKLSPDNESLKKKVQGN